MDAADPATPPGPATPHTAAPCLAPPPGAPFNFTEYPAEGGLPGWRETGNGRPLLLLHGWSVPGQAFAAQAALAEQGYRVIAPDHAGHGLSAQWRSVGCGTMAGLADGVARLIDALALRDAVVAGWSMGAMVAWELLRSRSRQWLAARVAMIGAIDMTPRLVTGTDWEHGLHGHYAAADAVQMAARVRRYWHGMVPLVATGLWAEGTEAPTREAAVLREGMMGCDAGVLAELWLDMSRQDYRPMLRAATMPLFCLYGERSRLYRPALAAATAALQPALRVATIPAAGHSPHMERPQAFNAALLRMIGGSSGEDGGMTAETSAQASAR
ncbi:alpha/beta fold hydrolase [Cupriavidus gilardii]|uniref:alpha/beta fold hydrolase n=1 Tax=Cupriavidus gilardii TaxID=82541 RepID=UPI001EE58895|nr:alpha/beta hydrolase [Cupriavidus gilardii]MCG5261679.1 alpha/beta hydrolase [Cupriavidus gilardii]